MQDKTVYKLAIGLYGLPGLAKAVGGSLSHVREITDPHLKN